MTVKIETYYDFRSPYAYFANYRIRRGRLSFAKDVEWIGRPLFIDVLLNLQVGRYDRLAANYVAFVQLASIRLWQRLNESASLVAVPV